MVATTVRHPRRLPPDSIMRTQKKPLGFLNPRGINVGVQEPVLAVICGMVRNRQLVIVQHRTVRSRLHTTTRGLQALIQRDGFTTATSSVGAVNDGIDLFGNETDRAVT